MAPQARASWKIATIGRTLAVVWPFLVIVLVLLLLGEYRSRVLAGARAYAVGNALWVTAQNDAVTQLYRYVESGDEARWRDYQREIAIPLNDRIARIELEKPSPDFTRARKHLLAGRNAPEDIDSLLGFFRNHGTSEGIRDAVVSWRHADALILKLDKAAHDLHRAMRAGDEMRGNVHGALADIDRIDAELAPIEHRFATQISSGARHLQRRLGWFGQVTGVLLTLVGLLLSIRAVRRKIFAEEALRESEERYALVSRAANDGIWDWDLVSDRVFYSQRVLEMLGFGKDSEASKLEMQRLIKSEDSPVAREQLQGHLQARKTAPLTRTIQMRKGNGEVATILSRSITQYDTDGAPIRIAGSYTDISEQVASERRQRLAARVFEAAYEGMLVTDERNRIVSANEAFHTLSGRGISSLLGRHVLRLCAPGTDPAMVQQARQQLAADGQWRGEVSLLTQSGEQRPLELSVVEVRDDDGAPCNRIYVCRDIAELKYAQARIRHLAYFDSLTGLPNRSYLATQFDAMLARASHVGAPLAVVFFDLDGFKEINDTLGHSAGDVMIRTVARRLGAGIREIDVLCRFGGDEFLLLLPDSDRERTERVVSELLTSIDKPLELEGRLLSITISAGFSLYPEDADDAESLVRDADMALYRAKERGKNIVEGYQRWMSREVSWRHDMLAALRTGLAEKQFELRFQPVVEMASRRISGVEALLYWNHPTMGVISPGSFIPLAEESGLIEPLGAWLIDDAMRCCAQWRSTDLQHFYLGINVSGYQLRRAEAMQDQVLKSARTHGIPPRDIVLEITERQIVYDLAASLPVLETLASLGVGLSIDDFGTGYSSLEYLKDMPVSQVKIDRTFVHKMATEAGDRTIVSAIISLGRSLGLQVVAEGVENRQQLRLLKRFGCNAVQGYYYAKPLSASEVPGFVRSLAYKADKADDAGKKPGIEF